MIATSKTKYLLWLAALIVIMACVPTFAAPVAPTLDPNAVGTYIVETANAAATQTAAALPTLTPTVTFTPTPRATNTPEPSATSTVIFIFASPTRIGPTAVPSNIASTDKNFACRLISITPANGTTFDSRVDFDATWRVQNIGQRDWDSGSVDYVYVSGDKFYKVEGYDLPKTLKVGDTTDLIVDMIAPKNSGTYTTNWTVRAGSTEFCPLSLTIVVK